MHRWGGFLPAIAVAADWTVHEHADLKHWTQLFLLL
jgi:hypothetical protein